MSNTCVSVECKDWISTVTIDNPPVNYLDKEVLSRLNKTVSEVYAAQADLRVVLIASRGRNFSAGIDYAGFVKMTKDEAGHFADVGYNLLKHIENLPVPVIAAVKGETTGAGLGPCACRGHQDRGRGRGLFVPRSAVRRAAHLRLVTAAREDHRHRQGKGTAVHRPDR